MSLPPFIKGHQFTSQSSLPVSACLPSATLFRSQSLTPRGSAVSKTSDKSPVTLKNTKKKKKKNAIVSPNGSMKNLNLTRAVSIKSVANIVEKTRRLDPIPTLKNKKSDDKAKQGLYDVILSLKLKNVDARGITTISKSKIIEQRQSKTKKLTDKLSKNLDNALASRLADATPLIANNSVLEVLKSKKSKEVTLDKIKRVDTLLKNKAVNDASSSKSKHLDATIITTMRLSSPKKSSKTALNLTHTISTSLKTAPVRTQTKKRQEDPETRKKRPMTQYDPEAKILRESWFRKRQLVLILNSMVRGIEEKKEKRRLDGDGGNGSGYAV